MKPLSVVVLALVVFFVARATAAPGEPTIVTRVDTVTPPEYTETVERLHLENDGLRARIEGLRNVEPTVIVRTDTLVSPPDTVIRFVAVDSRGSLSVDFLTSRDTLYAPELHRGIDVSACDEGWTIQSGEVICDRAQLGHLYVGPWLSRDPSLALWWEPSFRSPWEAFVRFGGTWDFGVRRGVRIF